jgi:hypothetical protein
LELLELLEEEELDDVVVVRLPVIIVSPSDRPDMISMFTSSDRPVSTLLI